MNFTSIIFITGLAAPRRCPAGMNPARAALRRNGL
jgi:hypothetical protein